MHQTTQLNTSILNLGFYSPYFGDGFEIQNKSQEVKSTIY